MSAMARVLVVDDEKLIVKGIRFSLEQDGMEVDLSLIHIFNELYTALQQGTVDGQENPIASISSSAFDEVQKYMCLDGHTYAPESMIMNLNFYNRLTDEERAWVDEATVYARDTQRQMVTDMEEDMLASIESKGVKICYEPDLASFRDATAELYEDPAVTALVPPELTAVSYTHLQPDSWSGCAGGTLVFPGFSQGPVIWNLV